MQHIIEAHLLTARHLLAKGDPQSALGEAEAGLLHAVSCGYGLLRIELLVAVARIRLAWPDAPKAIQAAREALDLAAHPDCQYAWGEADAAQAWGEAYLANHEPTLAKRAFTRALAVRQRIEHPGIAETERLARPRRLRVPFAPSGSPVRQPAATGRHLGGQLGKEGRRVGRVGGLRRPPRAADKRAAESA